MNDLINITGGILYIMVSVILLPLFFLTDIFIGVLIAIKYVKIFAKKMSGRKETNKEAVYQFLVKKHLIFYKN